ncbi:hepcidin-like [Enoplosus armatus]|uniref:hepcidin-like n=1 Tax=Enoplosus armatus TaxID=215367 RepID=UPI0039915401
MKTFCVVVSVAVMLAFVCLQESSASPVAVVQELEEAMSNDNPVAEHQEKPVESSKMPHNDRQKRHSGFECRPCCNMTYDGRPACGICCSF